MPKAIKNDFKKAPEKIWKFQIKNNKMAKLLKTAKKSENNKKWAKSPNSNNYKGEIKFEPFYEIRSETALKDHEDMKAFVSRHKYTFAKLRHVSDKSAFIDEVPFYLLPPERKTAAVNRVFTSFYNGDF